MSDDDTVRRLAKQVFDDIHRLEAAVQHLADRLDMPYLELWGGVDREPDPGAKP